MTGVPDSIDELNARAGRWVNERVHDRSHRTTGSTSAVRFEAERDFLGPLLTQRFDTDYVGTRRVHRALPLITLDGVRYSVPPACLGQAVEARVAVDSTELVVSWAGRGVALTVSPGWASPRCGTPPTGAQQRPWRWPAIGAATSTS